MNERKTVAAINEPAASISMKSLMNNIRVISCNVRARTTVIKNFIRGEELGEGEDEKEPGCMLEDLLMIMDTLEKAALNLNEIAELLGIG